MDYVSPILMNIGFGLVFTGLWKLGKQNRKGMPDPTGFLYQAAGAFTMVISGFFMRDAGTTVTCWNIAFGIVSLIGYRRLSRNGL